MSDSTPVLLRIRLPYRSEGEFIDKYGNNVARGGFFVATKQVWPEGTQLSFELVLGAGERLMRGEGLVQKSVVDPGGGRSGMTIRFLRIDGATHALVERIVARRTGGRPAKPAAEEPQFRAGAPLGWEPGSQGPAEAAPTPAPSAPEEPPVPVDPVLAEAPPKRRTTLEIPAVPAPEPRLPEHVLGIDLGTTNCRAAFFQEGKAVLVPLGPGEVTVLSSLAALGGAEGWRVGWEAAALRTVAPQRTVVGAKRLLGRRFRSGRVQPLARCFDCTLAPDDQGNVAVSADGHIHRLPDLAAELLRAVRASAEAHLGAPVRRAVIGVPAYFNEHQREAVLEAAQHAGLLVARLLNEPSAVALAYGYGRGLARKRVLVYDLGGGTFDTSVIELTGDDLEVVTNGGDNLLGGMDFDERVAEELARTLPAEARQALAEAPDGQQRLLETAEALKIALSTTELATARLALRNGASPREWVVELSRERLEQLTADLVERTLEVTLQVLTSAGLSPQSLDAVLLVGGQSRAPLVRRKVEALFHRPVRTDVDPHGAVALGAAVLGHSLAQRESGSRAQEVSLSEVLTEPIGIGGPGGTMHRVLEKNTRLPAEKTLAFRVEADQPLKLLLYQGHAPSAEENEFLGTLEAVPERSGELQLRFVVGPDGKLEVSAQGRTGEPRALPLQTQDLDDVSRADLLEHAPFQTPTLPPDREGLLLGLKRWFRSQR